MSLTSELLKERKSPEKWQEEVDALNAKIAELEEIGQENERAIINAATLFSQAGIGDPGGTLIGIVKNTVKRITELEQERRWIPVSERLPLPAQKADGYMSDSSELVHVYPPPRNDRGVCYLHYLGKWSCSAEVNVTHWMSLPPPPEEK